MNTILGFWGDKVVDDIDSITCEQFAEFVDPQTEKRISQSTARRCLEDLRAAVRRYVKDRRMATDGDYVFELPEKNPPRYGFFTRDQIARLVYAAYRKTGSYSYTGKRAKEENRGQSKVTNSRPRRHLARFILFGIYTGTRTDRIERASFYKESGRPWVDVDAGIFYRSWDGEMVPDNKRAGPIRIPGRLLAHLKRWKANGARYVVEYQKGKTGSTASAYFRLLRETLEPEEVAVQVLNRHALKHTCATWLMMAGEPIGEIAGFLETSETIIRDHYGHHHPDHQEALGDALTTGRAGRVRFGKEAKSKKPQTATPANNPAVAAEVRRAIRDLLEITGAPLHLFPLIDSTPDSGLTLLRESVKRAAQSKDWMSLT